ncbi:Clp protease N-terminal domain-containing protein [Streptomyces sp. NPDC047108]|uniref:Clp protease N-terminal domain-containing protein n=1 Tax=Streptomyces sp. NPDC047108 TaxID=3155025 RepID=UPI0034095E45
MNLRGIDPRDTVWEQDFARYRVYFWDVPAVTAHEYEVMEDVDVDELLAWTARYAADRGWTYTVYAAVTDGDGPGLIRLAGILGDPFAEGPHIVRTGDADAWRREGVAVLRVEDPVHQPDETSRVAGRLALALDRAEAEAESRSHRETDTGHLLLGILDEPDGAVAAALKGFGVSVSAVRSAVEQCWDTKPWRSFRVQPGAFPPFSIEAGEAREYAAELARGAGHDMQPEHLFLAMLNGRRRGPGQEALHHLGLTSRQARESLAARLLG